MSALGREIAEAVVKAANNGHRNHSEKSAIAAADAVIAPLVEALGNARALLALAVDDRETLDEIDVILARATGDA